MLIVYLRARARAYARGTHQIRQSPHIATFGNNNYNITVFGGIVKGGVPQTVRPAGVGAPLRPPPCGSGLRPGVLPGLGVLPARSLAASVRLRSQAAVFIPAGDEERGTMDED